MSEFSQSTYGDILRNLGEPEDHEPGFQTTGNSRGQLIEDMGTYKKGTPLTVSYVAKVVKEDGKLRWDISDVQPAF